MLTTLAYALASTVFAYSGIAHHDTLATGYLVIAFYLIFDLPRRGWDGRAEIIKSACAGLLLGLAVTTSMLVFFMATVCAVYFLWLRRWKLIPFSLAAVLIGLLPLFVYDARSFGDPFLLPNVVGAHMFADTFFHFSAKNFGDKLVWYSTMLLVYAPVVAAGIFGLSYFPRALKRTPFFLTHAAMLAILAGYSYLATSAERRLAGVIVLLLGVVSFAINLVGAVQGAMCCPDGRNALRNQLALLARGDVHYFPLAPWLLAPFLICAGLFAWTVWQRQDPHDHFTR